jgi:hypothetical protein
VDEPVRVEVTAASNQYDAGDEVFLRQVAQLRSGLRDGGATVVEPPGAGKGADTATAIVHAVVYSGAGLTALLAAVKQWVRYRGDRSVQLTVQRDGQDPIEVAIESGNLSEDALLALIRSVTDERG